MTGMERLLTHLKPRQAELLVTLGEEQHMGRTAQRVHMTQPAASKALAQLESQLGLALFLRTPQGMIPTEFGVIMLQHARHLLGTSARVAIELKAVQQRQASSLRIGTLPSGSVSIVPTLISDLARSLPTLEVFLVEALVPELLEQLRNGRLDIVIGRLESDAALDGLDEIFLLSEPMTLVCRASHPLTRKKKILPADLQQAEWVLPPEGTLLRRKIDDAFKQIGVTPPVPKVQSNVLLTNISLIRSNDWLAVLPSAIANNYLSRGELQVLPSFAAMTIGNIGALVRRERSSIPAVDSAVRWLKNYPSA